MSIEDLLSPELVPNVKLGVHGFQIFFGIIVFILEIVVFRAEGSAIVGNNGWPFAVCFLSVLAWVFLIMTPRYARTRRFAQPHAMAAIDGVFTIFWLSAFASQAAYNTANLCGTACGPSKGIVGLGIFITLAWGVTTFLSLYSVIYYQREGKLPGYDKRKIRPHADDAIDPDKAAFSMTPHDEDAYNPVRMDDHDLDHRADESYVGAGAGGSRHGGSTNSRVGGSGVGAGAGSDYDDDPARYGARGPRTDAYYDPGHHDDYDAGLGHGAGVGGVHYAQPSAQDDYDDESPAHFPTGAYERAR